MKKLKNWVRIMLAVAGVISTVMGVIGIIPSFLQSKFGVAVGSVILIIAGLVLLAIAYGDIPLV